MNDRVTTAVGHSVRVVVVEDLRRTQVVQYSGASGDFNPLHTDEPYARTVAERPTVMVHGMLSMGLTGRVVTDWFGADRLRSFGVRFASPVWPGDTLTVEATVVGLADVDDRPSAELTLSATNQVGVTVLTGTAHVWLGEDQSLTKEEQDD